MGKYFQSDADEALCDGAQLADEVADGMLESEWPSMLMHITVGNDSIDDAQARGGPRITELRNRIGFAKARLSADQMCTKFIVKVLPTTLARKTTIPALAAIFSGVASGPAIAEGLVDISTALRSPAAKGVDDRLIKELERHLTPIKPTLTAAAFASLPFDDRLRSVLERIEETKLCAQPGGNGSGGGGHEGDNDGEKGTASGRSLVTQLTKPEAITLLQRLNSYRLSAEYDPITYLEMAHSARWTPDLRAVKMAATTALPDGAARKALTADIKADDARAPIPALMQLAWGQVKCLEGYPELQDIYDLGQTRMTDVIGRLCARAYAADGCTIPPALRFARAVKLTAALRGRSWGTDVNFITDGDACMLSYIEGGDGGDVESIPKDKLYADISQVRRSQRIGTNVLAFFGIKDAPTKSWRQIVASCEHAFMPVAASDVAKRQRLGKAMARFITRELDEVGKRIDLVRYSSKIDAIGPRELLSSSKGGAADEFAEAAARIADDQKRKRAEVADYSTALMTVRVPAESQESKLASTLASKRVKIDEFESGAHGPHSAWHEPAPSPAGGKGANDSKVVWTPLMLMAKPKPGTPPAKITVQIDAKGAARWLQDKGVARACLPFQFGHASKLCRRWQSCDKHGNPQHTEAAEGPHAIVDGWAEAAPKFVRPMDRKLLGF